MNLAKELGNVSKACQVTGLSRDTFYRYKAAVEEGGVDALFEANRRKPNHKNRVEPEIEQTVKDYALDFPAHGQVRASQDFYQVTFCKKICTDRSLYKKTWTNGSFITIMNGHTKEKCVVDEPQWKHSSMARKSGRKN